MEKKKISQMEMIYEGQKYLVELFSDMSYHYCKVKINNDILEFKHNQRKSLFNDFTDNMKDYFSPKEVK